MQDLYSYGPHRMGGSSNITVTWKGWINDGGLKKVETKFMELETKFKEPETKFKELESHLFKVIYSNDHRGFQIKKTC